MSRRNRQTYQPETLAGLAAKGLDVWCWCDGCSHSAVLAISGLIERLGGNCPVPAVKAWLRCQVCGSRQVDARPNWPSHGVGVRHQPSTAIEAR